MSHLQLTIIEAVRAVPSLFKEMSVSTVYPIEV